MVMDIITNNHWREPISWYDLTDDERSDFDYIEDPHENGHYRFIRYRGATYDLYEFMQIDDTMRLHHPDFAGWHGYVSDSYFSGVVIQWDSDYEFLRIGTYMS